MAGNDWLEGYTLQELLGAAPVSKTKKQLKQARKLGKKQAKQASGKRGIVSTTVGAPFRMAGAVAKMPVTITSKLVGGLVGALTEIVKLPMRVVAAIFSPWKKQ